MYTMTKTQIKRLLKDIGCTKDELDYIWYYLKANNHRVVCAIDRSGMSWKELSEYAAKSLIYEYKKFGGNIDDLSALAMRYKTIT